MNENADTTALAPADAQDAARRESPRDALLDSAVENIVNEWRSVVPQLDPDARAIAARIARIASRLSEATNALLQKHALLDNEFRLLAGLMRSGRPYRCSPSALAGRYVPVTSGGLTGLVDRLEKRGLVQRVPHPTDQRSVLIELTRSGSALIRRVMAEFADVERRLVSGMSQEDRRDGNAFLKSLLRSIEQAML